MELCNPERVFEILKNSDKTGYSQILRRVFSGVFYGMKCNGYPVVTYLTYKEYEKRLIDSDDLNKLAMDDINMQISYLVSMLSLWLILSRNFDTLSHSCDKNTHKHQLRKLRKKLNKYIAEARRRYDVAYSEAFMRKLKRTFASYGRKYFDE